MEKEGRGFAVAKQRLRKTPGSGQKGKNSKQKDNLDMCVTVNLSRPPAGLCVQIIQSAAH